MMSAHLEGATTWAVQEEENCVPLQTVFTLLVLILFANFLSCCRKPTKAAKSLGKLSQSVQFSVKIKRGARP